MFYFFDVILADFFRDENNHLFFAPNSSSKPDVVSYLEKTKNSQLLGLLSRFSKKNAVPVSRLIDKYGIKPSQLTRLKKGKSFYIEDLDGNKCFLKKVN